MPCLWDARRQFSERFDDDNTLEGHSDDHGVDHFDKDLYADYEDE